MAAFDYTALDQRGKQQKGVLEADSARQVRQQLRDKGLAPLAVEPANRKARTSPVRLWLRPSISSRDLALCTRQMATLVQAGMPLEEVLRAVSQQSEKARIKSMMLAVRSKVLEGHTLAQSLGEFPAAFPELYRATVAAGEHAGHLDLVLDQLADYTEAREQSRRKIQLALLYPVILTLTSIVIVMFLLGFVVPDVVKVFANTGQELPPLTRGLIAASDGVQQYGLWAVIGIILIAFVFRWQMRHRGFRLRVHRRLMHLPFIARISRGFNTARFASTLSILTTSGVPLVEALKIAAQVVPNHYLRQRVEEVAQRVSEGASLRASLEQAGYFPPMMLHMIASGESSGELDKMLARAAGNQQRDLEGLVATLVGLFEPLMLLLMGGVVLVIVLAILLPILNLNQLVA